MPKRNDLNSILILGAGPIVIGQACEFDYSGTQACLALREEGYRVILVNSNPATIMTDENTADAVYIEPVQWQVVEKIIEKEKPDAILPTMGGQTALNCALDLEREGVLERLGVEMIGAKADVIDKAEDRERFRAAMEKIGLDMPRSQQVSTLEDAIEAQKALGFPTIIRPCFTLGGTGGGIAYNQEEFEEICRQGFEYSPTHELLLDESIIGWKEFEMEVVRDRQDNAIIVCAIENLDPMGIHTGDSITVAPAQTLTDKEYQRMRDASLAVLREIGVETGGSNVQFAISPEDGRMVVIEMNPRVSRSSALASKATGFPIAKIAAKLAVGYTLDELSNAMTGNQTPASFEPALDYVVVKIPRFNFEKFPHSQDRLTTQMKSVGEVMSMGRNFQEALQKALRGLEVGWDGFNPILNDTEETSIYRLRRELREAGPKRLQYVADAMRLGFDVEKVHRYTGIDPWFLKQIEAILQSEKMLSETAFFDLNRDTLRRLKRQGFSDKRIASVCGDVDEHAVRAQRLMWDITPVYKRVDTCAAEFATETAYLYSSYDAHCEANPSDQQKVMILGGGPNRIGQGIEFDYCCVHAALALREMGYETIMVNCNPETVSTDYSTSDRLYFESLTLEDVLSIIDVEKPLGVIVQYGGQTPLKLAKALEKAGVPIVGTAPDSIDRAEDREQFQSLLASLSLKQPANATVRTVEEATAAAKEVGYPLVVRPSYVLGGRAMQIVYSDAELLDYLAHAVTVSNEAPVLLDHFLNDAIEVDIDAVSDGEEVIICGLMEHIEQAGIHSGDSSCTLPAVTLSEDLQARLCEQMRALVKALNVVGLANGQFAIQGDTIYVLEINPRASRTAPFVSKVTGKPWAKIAARCMLGDTLKAQEVSENLKHSWIAVKKPVFPFARFVGADPILGPEMRSTGEVMGMAKTFGEAFAKACCGASESGLTQGQVFLSVKDSDKPKAVGLAKDLVEKGFTVLASHGTHKYLTAQGVTCERVNKVAEGRPHIVDCIRNQSVGFIINTTAGQQAILDSYEIRGSALKYRVPYTTTLAEAEAYLLAFEVDPAKTVCSLQDLSEHLC